MASATEATPATNNKAIDLQRQINAGNETTKAGFTWRQKQKQKTKRKKHQILEYQGSHQGSLGVLPQQSWGSGERGVETREEKATWGEGEGLGKESRWERELGKELEREREYRKS